MRGRVKYFSEKGYGFIKLLGADDADVFFHISSWQNDLDPERDQLVEFDLINDPKSGRPRAANLRLVTK
jgi:cold shock CspA family protein